MDIWEAIEQRALGALGRELAREPLNRAELEQTLHLLAIAQNRDPHVPMPPLNVFTDAELKDVGNALLSGKSDP